jgi:tetratricopeptide (TPR) repeat protein
LALARRYTVPTSGGARVVDEIRRRVRFEILNLGSEGVASWARGQGPFDAIFCRNTLIYFSRAAMERTLSVFEGALVEGGGLFLGASEALHPRRQNLRAVRGLGSFFYSKETAAPTAPPTARPVPDAVAQPPVAALYARGLGLLDAEEFEGAREIFRSLVALAPEDGRGHTGLALLLANEGRETEARRHLERGRRMGPDLAETHYLLGLLEERAGRESDALLHYRRALGIDPEFFMAHLNRAWILRRMGKTEAFAEELRQVRAILQEAPRASPWITGGLGLEALLDLVAGALDGAGGLP